MNGKQLEEYIAGMDSKYRAVIVASKRAKQLQQGLRTLFEGKSTKVTTMALEELVNKKVTYDIIEKPKDKQGKPATEETKEQDKSDDKQVE